jgi:hypothetical protein
MDAELQVQPHWSEQPSAYVRYFRELVELTASNQRALFDEHSLSYHEKFSSLDEVAQSVFARMMMRQGPWLRVSSLTNYLPRQMAGDEILLIETLECLQSSGLVEFLRLDAAWSTAWTAAASCLTADEIREICQKLTLQKPKG